MNLRRGFILLTLIFLIAFNYSQGAVAKYSQSGTTADPLVTKSYVEHYLGQVMGELQEQLAYLQAETNNLGQRVKRLESRWFQPITLALGKTQAIQGDQVTELALAPYTKDGRTMLPLRFIGEAMGAEVIWEEATRQAIFRQGVKEVALTIGSKKARLNGNPVILDTAPELKNSVTMVPARFVADGLGFKVDWLPEEKLVVIHP